MFLPGIVSSFSFLPCGLCPVPVCAIAQNQSFALASRLAYCGPWPGCWLLSSFRSSLSLSRLWWLLLLLLREDINTSQFYHLSLLRDRKAGPRTASLGHRHCGAFLGSRLVRPAGFVPNASSSSS
uniref:Putative secreted protein n=1 Tax=Anopheles darlingi TaxID=43151 RepID=A0A2M4D4X0_ANODA